MKKSEQIAMNAKVEEAMSRYEGRLNYYGLLFDSIEGRIKAYSRPLRHCNASVYVLNDGTAILTSYTTVIALIDKDGVCYDFLRKVYGYTATSAQHIRKFMEDYNATTLVRWDYV